MDRYRKAIVPGALAALLLPRVAEAASFKDIVDDSIVPLGNQIVTLLFAVAFLVILFGLFKYFFTQGSQAEEARRKGRQFMFWGIIGLAVLVAVWGIVSLLLGVLTDWSA